MVRTNGVLELIGTWLGLGLWGLETKGLGPGLDKKWETEPKLEGTPHLGKFPLFSPLSETHHMLYGKVWEWKQWKNQSKVKSVKIKSNS